MKVYLMRERRVHVCSRTVMLPNDFDPENEEHVALLEGRFDGEDFENEEIVIGEPLPLLLAEIAPGYISPDMKLSWEDLRGV